MTQKNDAAIDIEKLKEAFELPFGKYLFKYNEAPGHVFEEAARAYLRQQTALKQPYQDLAENANIQPAVTDAKRAEALRLFKFLRNRSYQLPPQDGTKGISYAKVEAVIPVDHLDFIESALQSPLAVPVGYVIGDFLTDKRARKNYEYGGLVMYAQPLGMYTTPVYAAPQPTTSSDGADNG